MTTQQRLTQELDKAIKTLTPNIFTREMGTRLDKHMDKARISAAKVKKALGRKIVYRGI